MGENKPYASDSTESGTFAETAADFAFWQAVLPEFSAAICGGVIGRYTDYKQASVRKSGGTAESLRFRPEVCIRRCFFMEEG